MSEDEGEGGAVRATEVTAAGAPARRARAADLDGLDRMVGYAVRRAQMWMIQNFRRALKDFDMTPAQFSVLHVIAANPGVSQARVAEALLIERARLVQMIDRLEALGHVERARSATDRRSHALYLTTAGVAHLKRARSAVEAHERKVVALIGSRDRDELVRILAPFQGEAGARTRSEEAVDDGGAQGSGL